MQEVPGWGGKVSCCSSLAWVPMCSPGMPKCHTDFCRFCHTVPSSLSLLPCPRGLSRSHSVSFLYIAMTPSATLHFLDASLIEVLSSCPHVTLALPLSLLLWPSGLHCRLSHTLQAEPWFSGTLVSSPMLAPATGLRVKAPNPTNQLRPTDMGPPH